MDLSIYRQPKCLLEKHIDWFWINIYGGGYHSVSETVVWPHASSSRGFSAKHIYSFSQSNIFHITEPVDKLVASAWCLEPEELWKDSPYFEIIARYRDFHVGVQNGTIVPTEYYDPKTNNQYYVDKRGYLWSSRDCYQHIGGLSTDGYVGVKICINGIKTTRRIHRIVAKHFCKLPERFEKKHIGFDQLQVNHIDGNPLHNNAENLEWCTCQENVAHAFRLHAVRGGHKVLSEEDMKTICEMMVLGYPDKIIADRIGRTSNVIYSIRHKTRPKYRDLWNKYKWPDYSEAVLRRQHICEMLERGFRKSEISKIMKLPIYVVEYAVQQTGSHHQRDLQIEKRIKQAQEKFNWRRTKAQQILMASKIPIYQSQYEKGIIPTIDDPRLEKP